MASWSLSDPRRAGRRFPARRGSRANRMKTARPPKRITIVIVDDHRMFREQLASLINQSPDMKVCAEADNVRQGFELIHAIRPSIAIVDISLKDSSGLELVKQLRAEA